MSPTVPTPDDRSGSSRPAPTIQPARCGTTLLAMQALFDASTADGGPRSRQFTGPPVYAFDPDLRARAASALEALATNAPIDRDDIVAAIVVIDSEAERLGDHGLKALGEQLRVIALLDTPRADDAIRPLLGQLAGQLRVERTAVGDRRAQGQ
jgi:hypothetical protein